MSFDDLIDAAIALLQKRGRITYRSLRRQFDLEDDVLEDLKFELVEGQRVAADEGGAVLIWTGGESAPPAGSTSTSARAVAAKPAERASSASGYTPRHLAEGALHARTATEGELKQVTVMFCDLVRSTELADRIGAEAMHDLLNAFFEVSLRVVHSYGGTINQFLGDGFMALFGAPVSYEDHAMRAVSATVALRGKLREQQATFGAQYGAEVTARFGLNTGKVVVGAIGDDLRMDYTAVGDTSNVASRLQSMAEPGEILISETVAFQVGGHADLEALPPRMVKGKSFPIAAYRVSTIRRPEAMDLGVGRVLSPFVGRRDELDRMLELANRLGDGRGHVVALRAGPGVGKSRLAHEFRDRITGSGTAFFVGRCISFEHTRPYGPLLDVIRHVAGINDADPPDATERKVRAYLESRGLPSDEWARYMLRLFGLEQPSHDLVAVSAEALQARTNQMFRELTERASQMRPLVIFVEDLHWVDSASEACLAGMIEVADTHPVLFVFTFRPTYAPPWLDRSNVTHLDLQRLPPEAGRSLVQAVGGQILLSEQVLSAILERAEGVPFFMEELTRAVIESGDADKVPATIQGIITSRIDRLPEPTKRALHAAAVLGREFTAALLREVYPEAERLDPILKELLDLAFIKRDESALEPTFRFAHALTQDVAYGSILTRRRRGIHRAAGAALERIFAGRTEEVLDRLAYHFSHAEDHEKAVHYLRMFAERAAGGYSHGEAARALGKAFEHAAMLGEEVADSTRLSICDEMCNSLYFLGRFQDTVEFLETCKPLVEAATEEQYAGIYHFWMGHTYSYLGRMAEAFQHAHEAIGHARACGDKFTEGRAAYVLERASFWSGNFPDAIRYAEQAIAALTNAGDRWWEGQSTWMIGWSHGAMGEFDEALAAEAKTRELGEEIEDPRLPCYAAWTSAVMLAMRGDTREAIEVGLRGLERSPDLLNTGVAQGFTGFAHMEAGNVDQAISMLQSGADLMREMRFRPLHGWFSIWCGEAHLARQEHERAEELARLGLTVCQEIKNLWGVGMAQRALGRIARARGDMQEASRFLDEAVDTFTPLHARYWIARVGLDRAEVAQERGDDAEATAELSQARAAFSSLASPHWVRETEAFALAHQLALETDPS